MSTKNQTAINNEIAAKTGLTAQKVKLVLDTLAAVASSELKTTGVFILNKIGKLKVKEIPERKGRNPQNGKEITVKASRRVRLSPNKAFKESF